MLLTGIAATAGILFSWNIDHRTGEFFAFYLALIGGVYGVFLSFDLLLLFVFYEIAIIPKYFLIAIWGSSPRSAHPAHAGALREYAAMKLALYSFAGSGLVLAGIIAAWVGWRPDDEPGASGARFVSRALSDVGLPAGLR